MFSLYCHDDDGGLFSNYFAFVRGGMVEKVRWRVVSAWDQRWVVSSL